MKSLILAFLDPILGIQVEQAKNVIVLSHRFFVVKILKEFNNIESNRTLTPFDVKLKFNQNDDGTLIDSSHHKSIMVSLRYLTHT